MTNVSAQSRTTSCDKYIIITHANARIQNHAHLSSNRTSVHLKQALLVKIKPIKGDFIECILKEYERRRARCVKLLLLLNDQPYLIP